MKTTACNICHQNSQANLKRLGEQTQHSDFVIALAGNPNTGKSTVFNTLTGLKQHTGNWPGKTVTRSEGGFIYNHSQYKIVDLPGTYSLLSTSEDEEVARNFILFSKPDVTVIVADATRLERNLNLVLQILEITNKAVLCLNLIDEAQRHCIEIDVRTLSRRLGIPVIPTSARSKKGISELLQAIDDVAYNRIKTQPYRLKKFPIEIEKSIDKLEITIKKEYPKLPNSRWIAIRLLEGDKHIIEAIQKGSFTES